MKIKLLKTGLTALAISVAGLANAQQATAIEDGMRSYSAISGGAVSIGAQPKHSDQGTSNIGGHLASQAAVAIGAYTTVKDIYAGAAVTTGAWSRVEQIYAGAGVGIGANGTAYDIVAGAAVVVGASATVNNVSPGAAITVGAGAKVEGEIYQAVERTDSADSAQMMTYAIQAIHQKFVDNPVIIDEVETYTDLSGITINAKDDNSPHYFRAINLAAGTTLTISGDVTVITSGAMTMGAGSQILLEDGANVTWILGGALTLGAESTFNGKAYINGAVSGATSDVGCGNLYATGAIGIRTIGDECKAPERKAPEWKRSICTLWDTEFVLSMAATINTYGSSGTLKIETRSRGGKVGQRITYTGPTDADDLKFQIQYEETQFFKINTSRGFIPSQTTPGNTLDLPSGTLDSTSYYYQMESEPEAFGLDFNACAMDLDAIFGGYSDPD